MQRPSWSYGGERGDGSANPSMQQQQQQQQQKWWNNAFPPQQSFQRAYDPYEVVQDENEAGYFASGGSFAQATSAASGGGALGTPNCRSNALPAASFDPPPPPERGIVATSELPAQLRTAFPFRYFNLVQSECFDAAFTSSSPLVVVAPTGAGKTGVLDLALARLLLESAGGFGSTGLGGGTTHAKALYIAPSRALVQERVADWRRRFGALGAACAELTGDGGGGEGDGDFGAAASASAAALLDAATIICATPEKLDATTRHRGTRAGGGGGGGAAGAGGFSRSAAFIGDVGLVLLDEVHLLSEAPRGATLEAVVARLRVLGTSPELSGRPLARVRFVAVSATMPNPGDVGAWLGGRGSPAAVRTFGDEVRPVPLRTLVAAYPDTRTDFLFERSLNRPLLDVLSEHGAGRPALVFCASRNGASDAAKFVAAAWKIAGRIGTGPGPSSSASSSAAPFDRRTLDSLASSLSSRPLADCVRCGVGFHHAGLEPRDRSLLEAAFASRQLPCLCTTSTLAVGVNLPAYLVVIKGTRRWCSAGEAATSCGGAGGAAGGGGRGGGGGGGGAGRGVSSTAPTANGKSVPARTTPASSGFVEYDATTILQMVGRAGRPQFDTTGVAVVMTQSSAAARFLELVRGSRPLDSQLEERLPEHLNAEIVLRTVPDVPAAVRWLKLTFLWARVRSDPASRGFPRALAAGGGDGSPSPSAAAAAASSSSSSSTLERLATQRYISSTVNALVSGGFATADPDDGYALSPTLAGQLAARHYVRLPTLAAARAAPSHASLPDLLERLCGAAEFSGVALRRSEKRQLAEMNKRAAAEGRPFVVAPQSLAAAAAAAAGNPKPKKTISTPQEKLLVLVSDALGEQPTEALDYSMRAELDGVLKTGKRIAACVAALFAAEAASGSGGGNGGGDGGAPASSALSNVPRLAATANAHRLARSLRAGCWDGTGAEARQLPGVGRTLGARLAAAGLGTMRALLRADGRDVERATGRPFPFGHQLVAEAAAMAHPSGVSVAFSRPELRRGGGEGGGGEGAGAGTSFARWEFSVTLTRGDDGDDDGGGGGEKENESALPPRTNIFSSSSSFYAKLVVGTPENDSLLLCETVSLGTFRSPYSVRLSAPAGGGGSRALSADAARPPAVVAAVLHDRVVGLDVVAAAPHTSASASSARANNNPAAAPPKSRLAPPPSEVPPAKKAATSAAAAANTVAGRQTNLFESFKVVPVAAAAAGQQLLRWESPKEGACVPEGGGEEEGSAAAAGKQKEKGKEKAAEIAPAAPAPDDDDEFADVFGFL